jgi:hypothetical protein
MKTKRRVVKKNKTKRKQRKINKKGGFFSRKPKPYTSNKLVCQYNNCDSETASDIASEAMESIKDGVNGAYNKVSEITNPTKDEKLVDDVMKDCAYISDSATRSSCEYEGLQRKCVKKRNDSESVFGKMKNVFSRSKCKPSTEPINDCTNQLNHIRMLKQQRDRSRF